MDTVNSILKTIYEPIIAQQFEADARMLNIFYAPYAQWNLTFQLNQRPCSGNHEGMSCKICKAIV
jgi:hypothetical protein